MAYTPYGPGQNCQSFQETDIKNYGLHLSKSTQMTKVVIRKQFALKILSDEIDRLKKLEYKKLKCFLGSSGVEVNSICSESGQEYTIEIEAIWDNQSCGHIRVLVGVSMTTGWRSYFPFTDDFIISSDNKLINEDV
jgi:hypothetical protein